MIKTKTLNIELEKVEREAKEEKLAVKLVIRAICLLIKVVRDMKINQTIALKEQYGENIFKRYGEKPQNKRKPSNNYKGTSVLTNDQAKDIKNTE